MVSPAFIQGLGAFDVLQQQGLRAAQAPINQQRQQAELLRLQGLDPVSQQNIAASQAGVQNQAFQQDLADKKFGLAEKNFGLAEQTNLANRAESFQRLQESDARLEGQRQQQAANKDQRARQQAYINGLIAKEALKIEDLSERDEFIDMFGQMTGNPIPPDKRIPQILKGVAKAADIFGPQGNQKGQGQGKGTEQQFFEDLIKGLPEDEQNIARRIKVGLAPRQVGSAAQTIADQGTSQDVADSEAIIAGAKSAATEKAKLQEQFKLEPAIAEKVATAKEITKANVKIATDNKDKESKYSVYRQAYLTLADTVEQTNSFATGPISGFLPVITQDAQKLRGAIALMAPTLRSIFRIPGEGSFSDQEQEQFLNMLPSLKDDYQTQVFKLKELDRLMTSKLAPAAFVGQQALPQQFNQGPSQASPQQGGQGLPEVGAEILPGVRRIR